MPGVVHMTCTGRGGHGRTRAFIRVPFISKESFLAGLAQSAQRTGRTAEMVENLNLILEKLPGTPYAARARRWKDQPEIAARTSMICQTCHEPGRLAPRMAALAQ